MSTVEFFYDLSSPWTRLAFHNIQPIIREAGADIIWRPFLVGGVFNAVNKSLYERRNPNNPEMRFAWVWLKEWADLSNLPMEFPSAHHPLKSVLPMRACCALENDQAALATFSNAAFHAYFAEQKNIDDPQIVAAVANGCGLNGEELVLRTGEQAIKNKLRTNTEEAIERGAYGSPTMFVDKEHMYFGNDQLPLIKQLLAS